MDYALVLFCTFIGFLFGLGVSHHKVKESFWKGHQHGFNAAMDLSHSRAMKFDLIDAWTKLFE